MLFPDALNVIDYLAERWARAPIWWFVFSPRLDDDLPPQFLNRPDQNQATLLGQTPVYGSDSAPKDAVDGNPESGSFPIHRATAAHN